MGTSLVLCVACVRREPKDHAGRSFQSVLADDRAPDNCFERQQTLRAGSISRQRNPCFRREGVISQCSITFLTSSSCVKMRNSSMSHIATRSWVVGNPSDVLLIYLFKT